MGHDTSQGTTDPYLAGLLTCARILTNLQEQGFSAPRYVYTSGTLICTKVGEQLQDTLGENARSLRAFSNTGEQLQH